MAAADLHKPFFSICIPAYKRVEYLDRLLHSVSVQTFKDFEVVLSDDSSDNSVFELLQKYEGLISLRYIKNPTPLGTPENWNNAMRNARGVWIKLMHDDDWFYDDRSLERFALIAQETKAHFIFSAYQNVFLDENRTEFVHPGSFRLKQLKREPATLLSKNIVGPPSVLLHFNDGKFFYDNKTKWVVDIDFYIRYLPESSFRFINEVLVCVGMSNEQVTRICSRIPEVEIPEYFYLADKMGWSKFNNVLVFDSLWRLLRNMKVCSVNDINAAGYHKELPSFIRRIIEFQQLFGFRFLSIGVFSKITMFICYLNLRNVLRS